VRALLFVCIMTTTRKGRKDRRGIGARQSPQQSLVTRAAEQIMGDDAAFLAVADLV
jgi:hypothetical protein